MVDAEQAAMDAQWMQVALEQAEVAARQDEIPVGAVLVSAGKKISTGYNQPITCQDPTAHAEIIALRAGAIALSNYRLLNTTLYVTLEPCVMCVGAMIHARISRLVFGASDPKAGAIVSCFNLLDSDHFNHHIQYQGGVLAEPCGQCLTEFFQARRNR